MTQPDLSVLLATPDDFSTLQETVRALSRQTAAHRLELMFAGPDESKFTPPPGSLDAFHSTQFVETPVAGRLCDARTEALRRARGRYVIAGEDHCQPRSR